MAALLGGSATTAVLATGGLLGLALTLALTAPITKQLRRQRIELGWWLGHGATTLGSSAVVGAPFEVCCELRNRGERGLWLDGLRPVVPQGARVLAPDTPAIWLAPASRTQLTFKLRADATGRLVMQGLSVNAPGPLALFAAALYFPSPLTIQVLPQAAHRRVQSTATSAGLSIERPGQASVRRRGDGSEIRELRELQPGDAFKSIAWRASARRGKLLVREMEHEVQQTVYLVVDISGTMRGGEPGGRRLDHAIELAAFAAREGLERGDQVGLVTVDGRIVEHVAPADGLSHMLRIYDALLSATEVVDADLTEATDDEVTEIAERYLRHQDGLDLRHGTHVDAQAVLAHAKRVVGHDPRVARILAADRDHACLRRFCQLRGLRLPYRSETRSFGKGRGLVQALMAAAGRTRVPRTIVTFSDFDRVASLDNLSKAFSLLRTRAHHLVVVHPQGDGAHAPDGDEVVASISAALGLRERRRLRELRRFLTRAGIPTITASHDTPAVQIVNRALNARVA